MNMGGFLVLICFGAVVASFPQVLFLNLGLAFLREKTNGLHIPTAKSCVVFSLICEYVCLYAIIEIQHWSCGHSGAAIMFLGNTTEKMLAKLTSIFLSDIFINHCIAHFDR